MLHFVGAGPGAIDLITVRGMRLISEADVIIYAGSLINKELLGFAKSDAKTYDSAHMTLEEIFEIITDADKNGLDIVRLHSGEPSLYGAIAEQMLLLEENNISYDCCPGVSACFGAAASLKMEYTLPDVSQSLIITRMSGRTKVLEKESIKSFAAHKATMAIYLSTGLLKELSAQLIEGGYDTNTPAVIVYKATWPEEKCVFGTVGDLYDMAKKNDIERTAIVLVGEVLTKNNFTRSMLYSYHDF